MFYVYLNILPMRYYAVQKYKRATRKRNRLNELVQRGRLCRTRILLVIMPVHAIMRYLKNMFT